MLNKKADGDPWKIIVGLIIVIIATIIFLIFFTDTFNSGSSNFDINCWELEIPGKCFCENPSECNTQEGRNECLIEAREKCNEK
jgi:hypothetical protein